MSQPIPRAELEQAIEEEVKELELVWLKDKGYSFADVLCDDEGVEYILDETENGTPGDDYHFSTRRINIPNFRQEAEDNINNQ